MNERAIEDTN